MTEAHTLVLSTRMANSYGRVPQTGNRTRRKSGHLAKPSISQFPTSRLWGRMGKRNAPTPAGPAQCPPNMRETLTSLDADPAALCPPELSIGVSSARRRCVMYVCGSSCREWQQKLRFSGETLSRDTHPRTPVSEVSNWDDRLTPFVTGKMGGQPMSISHPTVTAFYRE